MNQDGSLKKRFSAVYFVKEAALDAAVEETEGHCAKQVCRSCLSWINV